MDIRSIRHTAKMAEWSERIQACRTSGLTVKAWCADQGFNTKTYYRWERLYIASTATQAVGRISSASECTLVKLEAQRLPAAKAEMPREAIESRPLLLRYGSAALEFPGDTSVSQIAALLKLLYEDD